MNSDKHRPQSTAGNVMIYILLALALLGGLTMLIARQNDQASGEDLGEHQAQLLTTKVMAYAASSQNALDQMLMSGTVATNLSFLRPGDANFNSPPHINKIFHPGGGGLSYSVATPDIFGTCTGPDAGWYMGRDVSIEWTPTTANDIILTAYCIKQSICENINRKVMGSKTIPEVTGDPADYFVPSPDHSTHSNLTTSECGTGCEGLPTLCVRTPVATNPPIFTAYFILKGL